MRGQRADNQFVLWYENLVATHQLIADERQRQAVLLLQGFGHQLMKSQSGKSFFLISQRKAMGIYLYGGVGRGKTLLMDGFYMHMSIEEKWRIHFHVFMRHFHQKMREQDVKSLAKGLAKKYKLLCFDEFHVSDIADAMILAALLKELLRLRVFFVMTSNYSPTELYPNGLARHLFLPAIGILEERFQLVNLAGAGDYRQKQLQRAGFYFYPLNQEAHRAMEASFDRLACSIFLPPRVRIQQREISALKRTSDAIWFDFQVLCGGHYAAADYLRLAERFTSLFLSGVPQLQGESMREAARRFTWLIDVLYDKKISVVMSAAAPMEQLYGSEEGGESGRTLSRLREIQSGNYLSRIAARI